MLLDPPLEERFWPLPLWLDALTRRVGVHVAGIRVNSGRERWRYAKQRLIGFGRHFAQRYDKDARRRSGEFEVALPPSLQAVKDRSLTAIADYRPRFYDGAAMLFVADSGIYQACDARKLWSRFVAEVAVEPVAGDHLSMIMPPNNRALADAIARSLARAASDASGRADLPRRAPAETSSVCEGDVAQAPAAI